MSLDRYAFVSMVTNYGPLHLPIRYPCEMPLVTAVLAVAKLRGMIVSTGFLRVQSLTAGEYWALMS